MQKAKPKCTNCLFFKWTVAACCLCRTKGYVGADNGVKPDTVQTESWGWHVPEGHCKGLIILLVSRILFCSWMSHNLLMEKPTLQEIVEANKKTLTLVLLCPDIYGIKDVLDQ